MLSILSETPDVGAESWASQFHDLRDTPATYYIVVVVSRVTDRIVASGGVFIERKFLRGLGRVGHIEDIAVASEMQGKKLGLRLIQTLTHISEGAGSYKTILNCSDTNLRAFIFCFRREPSCFTDSCRPSSAFYEKCGFEKRENEMVSSTKSASLCACSLVYRPSMPSGVPVHRGFKLKRLIKYPVISHNSILAY